MTQPNAVIKAIDAIQTDLRTVCNEVKKKHPYIKDEIENALLKIRNATARDGNWLLGLTECSTDIVKPLIGACASTRQAKLAQLALSVFQKQIALEVLNEDAALQVVNAMYMLAEAQCEEVRVLQTVTLLVTTNRLVAGEVLAKALVLCLRMMNVSGGGVASTANAVFRQLVNAVMDRVAQLNAEATERAADATVKASGCEISLNHGETNSLGYSIVRSLHVRDACSLVVDLCLLEGGDTPRWLLGADVENFSKLFGLDVLEQLLAGYRRLFVELTELKQLVRDHVCLLLVRLLSAVLKATGSNEVPQAVPVAAPKTAPKQPPAKPETGATPLVGGAWYVAPFPSVSRLLRVLRILLLGGYFDLIVTECEIFLSMLIRLLETHNRTQSTVVPPWQRTLALEFVDALFVESPLVAAVGSSYEHLLAQLVTAVAAATHQLAFTDVLDTTSTSSSATPTTASSTPAPFVPTTHNSAPLDRALLLELANGTDAQATQLATRQYALTVAYSCLLNLIRSLRRVIESTLDNVDATKDSKQSPSRSAATSPLGGACKLIKAIHCGLLNGLESLIECSAEERCTATLLEALQSYTVLLARTVSACTSDSHANATTNAVTDTPAGNNTLPSLDMELEACLFSFCAHSLPLGYATLVLCHTLQHSDNTDRIRHIPRSKADAQLIAGNPSQAQSTLGVGVPLATLHVPQPQHFVNSVTLSSKHLQCFQTLLVALHSIWRVLDDAGWYMVFSCVQHVEWVCGVRVDKLRCTVPTDKDTYSNATNVPYPNSPAAVGRETLGEIAQVAASQSEVAVAPVSSTTSVSASSGMLPGAGAGSTIAATASSLVSQFSRILQRLHAVYATTEKFDLGRLKLLLNALVRLSAETAELCTSSAREPNLFSLQLVWDVAVHNLVRARIEAAWSLLGTHLIQMIQHGNMTLRVNAADCLVGLIRESLIRIRKVQQSASPSSAADMEYVLEALRSLSAMSACLNQTEIRLRQFECVQYLLQHCCDVLNEQLQQNTLTQATGNTSRPPAPALGVPSLDSAVWNTEGWLIVLGVIGTVNDANSEQIIRKGFSCLQLIANEYLVGLPPQCYSVLIDITSKYTQQLTDLNIALSAIGALWHVADFFQQNASHLQKTLQAAGELSDLTSVQLGGPVDKEDAEYGGGRTAELSAFDLIVLRLYSRLARACFDFRSTIRKSAIQTLFLALQLHTSTSGSHWTAPGWCVLLYRILFPTLRNVVSQFFKVSNSDGTGASQADLAALEQAEREAIGAGVGFVAHHSRATAEQKWAETVVLALSSTASFVNRNLEHIVSCLHDAPAGQSHVDAWCSLLDTLCLVALSSNSEVAYQALKSFAELVQPTVQSDKQSSREQQTLISNKYHLQVLAFDSWLNIGRSVLHIGSSPSAKSASGNSVPLPNQQFLILFVRAFNDLLVQLNAPQAALHNTQADTAGSGKRPTTPPSAQQNCGAMDGLRNESNLRESFTILYLCLLVPILPSENVLYLLPDTEDNGHDVMTPLQRQILDAFELMSRWSAEVPSSVPTALTSNLHFVLEHLLIAIELACRSPTLSSIALKHNVSAIYQQVGASSRGSSPLDATTDRQASGSENASSIVSRVHNVGFIVFGEKCLKMCVNLYRSVYARTVVVKHKLLERFLRALHLPLSLKFACVSHTTWIAASRAFEEIIEVGLNTALLLENAEHSATLWPAILSCVDDFLFGKQNIPLTLSVDEFREFENIDCEFLLVIRRYFLGVTSADAKHSAETVTGKVDNERRKVNSGTAKQKASISLQPIPSDFLAKLLAILNKGALSISDSSGLQNDAELSEQAAFVDHFDSQMLLSGIRVRSQFDLLCFETLLEYALMTSTSSIELRWNAQVLEGLLEKAKRVLSTFLHDQRLTGAHGTLPRVRYFELTQILRSLLCVFAAVRKVEKGGCIQLDGPAEMVSGTIQLANGSSATQHASTRPALSRAAHKLLVEIYPLLVDCTVIQQLFSIPAFSPLVATNVSVHSGASVQGGDAFQRRSQSSLTDSSPSISSVTVAQSVHDVLAQYVYLLNPVRHELDS